MIYNIRKYPEKVRNDLNAMDMIVHEVALLNNDLLQVLTILETKGFLESVTELESLQKLYEKFQDTLDFIEKISHKLVFSSYQKDSDIQFIEEEFRQAQKQLKLISKFLNKKSMDYDLLLRIISSGKKRYDKLLKIANFTVRNNTKHNTIRI